MAKFRFEDLEIWKEAIEIGMIFLDIADELEEKKLRRFADQGRGVGMGIPNNISGSTGTNMRGEQHQFLRYSKRECFEGANILVMSNDVHSSPTNLKWKYLIALMFYAEEFNPIQIP